MTDYNPDDNWRPSGCMVNLENPKALRWATRTGLIFNGVPSMIAAGAVYLVENADVPLPASLEEPTLSWVIEHRAMRGLRRSPSDG
jgi:hypothetical protein